MYFYSSTLTNSSFVVSNTVVSAPVEYGVRARSSTLTNSTIAFHRSSFVQCDYALWGDASKFLGGCIVLSDSNISQFNVISGSPTLETSIEVSNVRWCTTQPRATSQSWLVGRFGEIESTACDVVFTAPNFHDSHWEMPEGALSMVDAGTMSDSTIVMGNGMLDLSTAGFRNVTADVTGAFRAQGSKIENSTVSVVGVDSGSTFLLSSATVLSSTLTTTTPLGVDATVITLSTLELRNGNISVYTSPFR